MAVKFMDDVLKSAILNAGFEPTPTGHQIEAFNDNTSVSGKINFTFLNSVNNSTKYISSSISIPVGNVIVNKLRIYKTSGSQLLAYIDLEGTEIKDFTGEVSGGIYQINTLKISI